MPKRKPEKSTNFRMFAPWRVDFAHTKCKNHTVKMSDMKTENTNANGASSHTNPSPPLLQNTPTRHHPHSHTHLVLGLFVGAGIQQQPRAVRETIVSGIHERRPSVLRAPPQMCRPQCMCRRSATACEQVRTTQAQVRNEK